MKKLIALVLAVVLLSICGAPAMATETLKGWGAYAFDPSTGLTSYKEQIYWKAVEEKFDVDIEWEIASTASGAHITQFGLIMASGNLPDFFTGYNKMLSLEEYGRMGAIMDVSPLIEGGHMPNLSAILEEYPDVRASITSADGAIYIIPRVMIDYETRAWPGFNIRGDILEELNMSAPTTTDELYEVLKAMKNIDGVVYPFCGDYRPLFYAFGVAVRATGNNADADIFVEDGQIKFAPWDVRYKAALEYLSKLASEGLIASTYDQIADMTSGASMMTFGSFAGCLDRINGLFEAEIGKRPLIALDYFTGPEGYKGNASVHRAIDSNWCSGISTACKNPELAAQILDYALGKEGGDILFYGIEGVDYTRDENGEVIRSEEAMNSPLGILTWSNNYVGNYSCLSSAYTAEAYQSTLTAEARRGNDMATATTAADPSVAPIMRYTADEIAAVNEICLDLNTYVDENMTAFVFGTRSLSEWDDYVAGFETLRVNELLTILNAAYGRYIEAAGK